MFSQMARFHYFLWQSSILLCVCVCVCVRERERERERKKEREMLSEISQTEKDKYCMLSLTCGI